MKITILVGIICFCVGAAAGILSSLWWLIKKDLPSGKVPDHPCHPRIQPPEPWPRGGSKFAEELETFIEMPLDPPEKEVFEKALAYIKKLEREKAETVEAEKEVAG